MWKNEGAYDPEVYQAAARWAVPVALIKAVIGAESAFQADARRVEPKIGDESVGLMQLLYRRTAGDRFGFGGDITELENPAINIELGARLLSENLRQARGNWDVAISAYNAGFSSDRPWDAKRKADWSIINLEYVTRVRRYWQYFESGRMPLTVGVSSVGGVMFAGIAAALALGLAG